MVINKIYFLLIFFILFISTTAKTAQIVDYETEEFINGLINDIKVVNKIKKNINFKIINNNNINAFVDVNNVIHITSGLIEHCPDYVAFLSVLAHEIGHIDKNHISMRKLSINKVGKIKNLTNFSIIAGSLITSNPQLLQSAALSSAGFSNYYINFSKEQELEADYYSLNTLNKLKINSDSISELLNIIEKKALEKGFSKEKQRISSHPYFSERQDIISYLKQFNKNYFNEKTNIKFNFIKSKFAGYNNNTKVYNSLNEPFSSYANSIIKAKNGNLSNSLKILNNLISEYNNNIFLIETKADILYSYGYTRESIAFYKLVLKETPKNSYAQIRIFANQNIDRLDKKETEKLFNDNINLLKKYYNNKNIILKYLEIAEKNNMFEWINFLNFYLNREKFNMNEFENKIVKFRETNDINLFELINIIDNKR